jgi:hypothetical protein
MFNVAKNKRYDKCEECRDLQKRLKTNHIVNGTFVYGVNKERYFIDQGKAIQACAVYTCNNLLPCSEHTQYQSSLMECARTKCNNCYVSTGYNECERCRGNNVESKNRLRKNVKDFKQELGGKCVDCGFDELFFLEFDHIDPKLKQKQITRSAPAHWEKERENLELRCGRCHRYKSRMEMTLSEHNNKHIRCRRDKRDFVNKVKIAIRECQLCHWTSDDETKLCVALDFDHITGDKYKQVSYLYTFTKQTIAQEIVKTRLLCRHCHEMHTCLQRGGKALKMYYTEEEIAEYKNKLDDPVRQEQFRQQLVGVLNEMGCSVN